MGAQYLITTPRGHLEITDGREMALLRHVLDTISSLSSYAVTPRLTVIMDTVTVSTLE